MEVGHDGGGGEEVAGFSDSLQTKPLEVMILERSKLLQVQYTFKKLVVILRCQFQFGCRKAHTVNVSNLNFHEIPTCLKFQLVLNPNL